MTSATRSISAPGRLIISAMFGDQGGRQVVDDEPAQVFEGRGRGRTSGARHPRHYEELAHWVLSLAHGAHAVVDGDGHPLGQPRQRQQLLQRGGADGVDAPELLDQPRLAGRSQPGYPVQDAPGHALPPLLAVEGDGEPVGLVTDPLEEVEGVGPSPQADGLGRAGAVDLLELLGQRRQLDLVRSSPSSSTTRSATPSWPLPAVDQQEVGPVGEAAGAARSVAAP